MERVRCTDRSSSSLDHCILACICSGSLCQCPDRTHRSLDFHTMPDLGRLGLALIHSFFRKSNQIHPHCCSRKCAREPLQPCTWHVLDRCLSRCTLLLACRSLLHRLAMRSFYLDTDTRQERHTKYRTAALSGLGTDRARIRCMLLVAKMRLEPDQPRRLCMSTRHWKSRRCSQDCSGKQ